MRSAKVVSCIAGFIVACSANALQPKAAQPLELSNTPRKNPAVVLTVTNTADKPAFFLRPDRPWHWYGWEITIVGADGEFAFFPPPPSPWVGGTESFILLNPGESFRTTIDLAAAKSRKDPSLSLATGKGPYDVRVAYIFDADREIKQSPNSQFANLIARLTASNFRPHDYGYMAQSRSNTIRMTTR